MSLGCWASPGQCSDHGHAPRLFSLLGPEGDMYLRSVSAVVFHVLSLS